jgi:hypothetical protein
MNAIVKAKSEVARKAKSTDEQILMALGPLFVAFPNGKATEETLNLYKMMLRDIEPDALVHAVLEAIRVCKFFPTIAEIREHVAVASLPGPKSQVSQAQLDKPIPEKMFRLDPQEDRAQRLERLRQTKNWDKYYA